MAKSTDKETPLMRQYNQIKGKYPDALLLFRVGDFYETFGEDAITASKILGIVLTKRANGAASHIELAGFPHHSLESYLPKLVRAGQRVAVCDQLEDPKLTKTIVKRGVTELVSPGVAYTDKILDARRNNFLAAVYMDKQETGVALVDISTGEFMAAQGKDDFLDRILRSHKPAEIILPKNQMERFRQQHGGDYYLFGMDTWMFEPSFAEDKLKHHFGVQSAKGFGLADMPLAQLVAGTCLHHLNENQHQHLSHIRSLKRLDAEGRLWLDRFTMRNLELLENPMQPGTSLVEILDQTTTPMGGRMLRNWLVTPLADLPSIQQRHDAVQWLVNENQARQHLTDLLPGIGDLARLTARMAMLKSGPRELVQLGVTLERVPEIIQILDDAHLPEKIRDLFQGLNPCPDALHLLKSTLTDDAPAVVGKGQVIKEGVHSELDQLRLISRSGKEYLAGIQQREAAATGIPSLKVAYNNVFGYYIEVTNAHKDKVPNTWHRKQTLTNAERYITPELKTYEEQILGAEEKILALEIHLFQSLLENLQPFVPALQQLAYAIGTLDVVHAFACQAIQYHYCRPEINEGFTLELTDSRHPVIERLLPEGSRYVPNDVVLDQETCRLMVLTGPNMSGKSALLRQTALCVLMAQAGSFVPARSAKMGLFDGIYTRVGASDNLAAGESTFMVEMTETAGILHNLTPRSLILLDELGRGTSTFDGISLAWSIAEFLAQHPAKPKTLFATHYHELNELEGRLIGVKNYHISLKETGNSIVFLRKLTPGGTAHSFGLHVAKMAGVPSDVILRATEVLAELEAQRDHLTPAAAVKAMASDTPQMSFFSLDDPLLARIQEELRKIDVNGLTPVEALLKLAQLKKLFDKI